MPEPRIDVQEVLTAHGPARAHLHVPARARRGLLVLGHGAGGGVDAPDLLAVAAVATELGMTTALVEQPYRTAGRRGTPRAPTLDAAWTEVLAHLVAGHGGHLPLVTGGRSAGARVACRTAGATGADAVLCLAFPVQPPGRPDRPSRLPELDGAVVPVLVVQGDRDPYGLPPSAPGRTVAVVPGDHSLRRGLGELPATVRPWLEALLSR
ncbi:alpha/beta hydrolase [Actinotalea sp. BY-33]|uniref:Alpha/beta hydrolase n=1 Tax=Actinotalea soli TaxID=2819234 RepID=A0A939LPN9_9CELL|nr:alpha/beta family hydrolase [Actinotalea soli]MBO1752026.1 alpha/beta hydrolase [Actinotalea soli]